MTNRIHVAFEHEGKHIEGFLQCVSDAGGNVYHLMIDNYCCGRLRTANDAWVLDVNKKIYRDVAPD